MKYCLWRQSPPKWGFSAQNRIKSTTRSGWRVNPCQHRGLLIGGIQPWPGSRENGRPLLKGTEGWVGKSDQQTRYICDMRTRIHTCKHTGVIGLKVMRYVCQYCSFCIDLNLLHSIKGPKKSVFRRFLCFQFNINIFYEYIHLLRFEA